MMDPKDILDCATEGMKWLAMGGLSYIGMLAGSQAISAKYSQRIETQAELESIVEEEAQKLGLKKRVKAFLHDGLKASSDKIRWYSEDGDFSYYKIDVGGFQAKRSTVKHELYHIHKGHFERRENIRSKILQELAYLFKYEPQATLYELFGIKV